jgi:hypothetical protein
MDCEANIVIVLAIAIGTLCGVMASVGDSILSVCSVPVRVWVASSVPSEDLFATCDFTIR